MVYTANWGIIYHLPPIKGTRNNYWKKAFQLPNIHFVARVQCEVLGSACLLEIGWYCKIKPEGPDSVFILIRGDSWKRVQVTCLRTILCSANCWGEVGSSIQIWSSRTFFVCRICLGASWFFSLLFIPDTIWGDRDLSREAQFAQSWFHSPRKPLWKRRKKTHMCNKLAAVLKSS